MRSAFTLVEMIVVIGVIGLLISLLLPALQKARQQANQVVCMSNLRQIGIYMLSYAEDNNGYLFPPGKGWPAQHNPPDPGAAIGLDPGPELFGTNTGAMIYPSWPVAPQQLDVWPAYITSPHVWNPKIMLCPTDIDPQGQHSYLANAHLLPISMNSSGNSSPNATADLRWGRDPPTGKSYSDIIVVGEKISSVFDYYMDPLEFPYKVEPYRHGLSVGSNYLMMDTHVETMGSPVDVQNALDPWDPYNADPTPTPTPTPTP
jgi:prepilin-type N-terminal cleavage/methylation domain-containing protein